MEKLELSQEPATIKNPSGDSDNIGSQSDLLKRHYFGCGPLHPKWLQFFANKKFFTFLSCCFTFLHSSIISGYVSVVLSTIQTRYKFSSLSAGFIIIAYDLAVAIGIVFVTYFANFFHKPRVLGIQCIVLGIASLLFALPQFIFGRYESGSSFLSNEICSDNRTFTTDCSSGNNLALAIFVTSSILLGIPATVLYTLTGSYMDEIIYPRFLSLHLGAFNIFLILGPAAGYLLGSACLSVYVDPWIESSLTESDPAWVGAWWIPFILVGVSSFILSIPYLMYPKWLSDSHLVRKERMKLMTKVYEDKNIGGNKVTVAAKMFPIQMKRLFLNPSLMFASFGLAVSYIFSQGAISFTPKYLENEFYLTSSTAGLLTGFITIPAAVIGILLGSFLVYIFKLNGKQNVLVVTIIILTSLLFLTAFLIRCPTIQLNTEYGNTDNSSCASICNCTSTIFEPVCGSDGMTYFSACQAGCTSSINDDSYDYVDCSCITDSATGLVLSNSTATSGLCESTCILIVPTLILFLIAIILLFVVAIPYQYFILRVVADDQRALALGLQSAIWRIFGAVPGPLLFGALFDLSCILWQDECGRRGNCWVHDNDKLSTYVVSVAFPTYLISGCLFFLAFLTFPKKSVETNVESKLDDGLPNQEDST